MSEDQHRISQDELKAEFTDEDRYFKRLDQERLAAAALRQSRQGKILCPKDGAELQHSSYHGFEVEKCPTCNGLWLDAHEAEALHRQEHKAPGLLKSLFGSILPDRNAG